MTKLRRILLPAFALPFAAIALHAQSQPSPSTSAPASSGAQGDETVKLSEFTVSAAPTHGYSASETMTGSRVNTKIIDLPYSVVNLTSEFFKDFGMNILDEDMTYIGGFTNLNIGGSFTLRGFASTSQLRDGFYRLGRYGGSNVDRIEIIRGPNAAIYGRTSPGGMVNMISLQPKKTNMQSLYILNGSYERRQEQLEATGSIGASGKTYYIVSLDQTERRYDGQFTHIRNNEDYIGVRHDFSDSSHLTASAEYFLQVQHSPQQAAQPISITTTPNPGVNTAATHVIGYDTALAGVTAYGNHSELNRGEEFYNIEYDKEFNDVWSLRTAANNFRARRWDFNQNTGWAGVTLPAAAGAPITDSRGATPTKGLIQEDGGGIQSDLVAHYFMFNHAVENKSLLTVDYNDYYRWDPTWNTSPDAALTAWNTQRTVSLVPITNKNGQINYVPASPNIAYFPENFQWGHEGLSTLTRRRTTSLGGNLRQQSFFFDGRLITFAGVRYDAVRFSQRDYTVAFPSVGFDPTHPVGTSGASVVRRYFHQTKPNLGFNYKVTSNLHLYGSYSESYFVDQTNRPVMIAGYQIVNGHPVLAPFQPETAKGWDYGIKGAFFDEKLNFTLGGFYVNRYNVSVTDSVIDPTTGGFINVSRSDGNQQDKGLEFDASWLPNDNLSLTVSAATVNAKYTFFGAAFPEAVGRSVNGVTPENGSFITKYTWTQGALKGLDVEGLVTYVSSTPSETPTSGDTPNAATGIYNGTNHTDQWKLRTPSFTLWNFGAHYKLPWTWGHLEQTVGLNIVNAFNKYYLKTSKNLGDSRSIMVSYQITHF
ncbi:MAG TPA: TonB-dependent receptor [Opitutaceae bacterium]|jgi:iron complex outermembrane receptor protein|nr:TonB-dependent receptor [Opitutaceae bacterium]